jgi:predicted PurR-regulated permease PerM
VLAFIPNIGPIISAVPAILIALATSPERAVGVALLFWGVHALEGLFVTPVAERRAVKLPPALTIGVQVLLGLAGGVLGVALAAPLTAAGLVLVRMLYVEDVLGDRWDAGSVPSALAEHA